MKRLNTVLRLTFSLATMFAIVFLSQAEPGNKRPTTTLQKTLRESPDPDYGSKRANGRERRAIWWRSNLRCGSGTRWRCVCA